MSDLPTYVSANPELLPQLEIDKGDMTLVMKKLEKNEHEVYIITCEMSELRAAITRQPARGPGVSQPGPLNSQPGPQAESERDGGLSMNTLQSVDPGQSVGMPPPVNASYTAGASDNTTVQDTTSVSRF